MGVVLPVPKISFINLATMQNIYNPGKPGGKQIEKQCEHAHWVSTWHSNMITRTFHTIQTEDCKNTKQMKNNKQINDDEQSIKVLMHSLGRPHTYV